MRALNIKQLESKVNQDIEKMTAWAERFQADANRQGNLDLKYLADRYDRGVAAISKFGDEKHSYSFLEGDHGKCPAEILKTANSMRCGKMPNLD